MFNLQKGKWFKFNDTVVEEFEMIEDSLEVECFGGIYKVKILEFSKIFFLVVLRKKNFYMYQFFISNLLIVIK